VTKRVESEKDNLLNKWKQRSDYNAMLCLRVEDKETKGDQDDDQVDDENQKQKKEVEKLDNNIGNQYDWIKSIIQNYDKLYQDHIELKKKYEIAENEIEQLKKKNDYRPGRIV
jgi:hypothetical protein